MTKSLMTAVLWYEKAAENGNANAKQKLGKVYAEGGENFEKNYVKAAYWYEEAVAAESADMYAYEWLGYLYGGDCEGVKKDIEKSKAYYQKAIELGSTYAQERLDAMNASK